MSQDDEKMLEQLRELRRFCEKRIDLIGSGAIIDDPSRKSGLYDLVLGGRFAIHDFRTGMYGRGFFD